MNRENMGGGKGGNTSGLAVLVAGVGTAGRTSTSAGRPSLGALFRAVQATWVSWSSRHSNAGQYPLANTAIYR